MKRQTCGISFLLFVLLLGSSYGQISWATPLTDFPDVSPSSTDFSAGIADSNFFLNEAGIAQSLNGDTIPCGDTQVTLEITKNVRDPGDRLSDSRALRFDVTVQQSGVPNGVVPLLASENDPGHQSTCIESNRAASVFEISGSTGIFTFTANRCDVPALPPGARGTCVLTNTITGTSAGDSDVGV